MSDLGSQMKQEALARLLDRPDRIGRLYGITREEILDAAGELVLKALMARGEETLDDLHALPLSLAVTLTGSTKYELQKECEIIDLGRRNQRITRAELKRFLATKTKPPKKPTLS